MHGVIDGADEMVDAIYWREVMAPVFGETAARSGAIDIAEGLCCVEAEFVGADADDWSVGFV